MKYFVSLLLLIGLLSSAYAQKPVYDPYRWINDPLAIADLGGPDSLPMMRMFDAGTMKLTPRDFDNRIILAGDTGVGVIRHLWAVITHQSPQPRYRLWVDDSLLIDAADSDFFVKAHGMIRPPLDSSNSGGFVCETQIPYKHSFRWTTDYTWLIRHCEWQNVDTEEYSLPALQQHEYQESLSSAEAHYDIADPWPSDLPRVTASRALNQGDTLRVEKVGGPAAITDVRIELSTLDSTSLRDLWLVIRWDDEPTPSVESPLGPFFGIGRCVRTMDLPRFSRHSSLL